MKAKELREKSEAELLELLEEQYKDLFKLRMQKSVTELKTTHMLLQARKNIARIKTILKEFQLKESSAA